MNKMTMTQEVTNSRCRWMLVTPEKLSSRPGSRQARIENVAQGVTEKIDAEDGGEDAQAGKERQPPCGADGNARVGQPRAPGGNLRRYADAKDAEPRFGDNGRTHVARAADQ